MLHELEQALQQLRRTKPLVLCLSNYVTMDFIANTLLSLGAAPIMSEDEHELPELLSFCHALYVNIGTLNDTFLQRARVAIKLAKERKLPIILDPVGAGASTLRTTAAREFAPQAQIIRGNASEILALGETIYETLGVESSHQVSDAKNTAQQLATQHACVVAVSGEEDFISDGRQESFLAYGSPLMPLVTGMGCSLTGVIAAFRAVINNNYHAARLATAYFGLCGNLAAAKTDKPGSFRSVFLDEVYAANFEAMRAFYHAA